MLQYTPWKVEQNSFDPQEEPQLDMQLAVSNGYISQYAFFEERYTGEKRLGTFIEGILVPDTHEPLCLPNLAAVSLHLGANKLDLNQWKVERFYRCLHKGEARIERSFTATSPDGYMVEVQAERRLCQEQTNVFEETYRFRLVNYAGPISFMTLIGEPQSDREWYPLQTFIDEEAAWLWLQASRMNLQLCAAQTQQLYKNGVLFTDRPVKIEKKRVLGYSFMTDVYPGDEFMLKKRVAIVDSRTCPKTELPQKALAQLK